MDDDDDLDLSAWQPPAPPPGIADAVMARMQRAPISTPVEVTRRPRSWWVLGALATFAATGVTGIIITDLMDHRAFAIELRNAHEETGRLHEETVRLQSELASVKQLAELEKMTATSKLESDKEILEQEVRALLGQLEEVGARAPAGPATPSPKPSKPCDAAGLKARGEKAQADAREADALAFFERSLACTPDVDVEKLALFAACGANMPAQAKTHYSRIPVAVRSAPQICRLNNIELDEPQPPSPPCDVEALKTRGDKAAAQGNAGAALASFERALACKADPQLEKLAYMTACESKNGVKARLHFGRVPASVRTTLRQICIRNGITLDDPPAPAPAPPPCDADALKKQGDDGARAGLDAQALASYERAGACRPSLQAALVRFELMESCKSKNLDKAHKYWKLLPPEQRDLVRQICVRNGIVDLL